MSNIPTREEREADRRTYPRGHFSVYDKLHDAYDAIDTLEQQQHREVAAASVDHEQIAALEQRLEAAEQAHRVCRTHLEKAESRRDTVETQLLAKTLDTDRIDWLETLIAPSISQYESSWQIHNCGHRTVAVFLRQCIDAARKEEKP